MQDFSIFRASFLAALLVLGAQTSRANAVVQAQSAIMDGKYEQAIDLLRPAASEGDAKAQYVLGNLYRKGWGVREDMRSAVLWYERSAERGFVDAQHTLGELYYAGDGVPKNHEKALHWFRRAAVGGAAQAPASQYLLGLMLQKGEGARRDVISAYVWISIASINAIAPTTRKEYANAADALVQSLSSEQFQAARGRLNTCLASNYTKC